MEITDIKIRKIAHEEKLKAIISVTFDNQLAVHDIKIIDGNQKLFVAMPSRKNQLGEYKDIVHPINASTRDYIQSALIDACLLYTSTQYLVCLFLSCCLCQEPGLGQEL